MAACIRTNQNSTAQDGGPASSQRTIKHNGQSLVGDDIAQQQSHKDPMLPPVEQSQNFGGMLHLGPFPRCFDDLQVDLIL